MKITNKSLFLELAQPNEQGISRWVNVKEFVGKYKRLQLGNGFSWGRRNSSLAKEYRVEVNKSLTSGSSIDAIRLNGFNLERHFNQSIRQDIKNHYKNQPCVMLGIKGFSENTRIEIDHKDGRKNDLRVSDINSQTIEDFQPLSKAANDVKRQICKRCKETNKRWSAKNIKGNPFAFYEGDENYTNELGCVGCYQYDPVAYRKMMVKKVSELAAENAINNVLNTLYPED